MREGLIVSTPVIPSGSQIEMTIDDIIYVLEVVDQYEDLSKEQL